MHRIWLCLTMKIAGLYHIPIKRYSKKHSLAFFKWALIFKLYFRFTLKIACSQTLRIVRSYQFFEWDILNYHCCIWYNAHRLNVFKEYKDYIKYKDHGRMADSADCEWTIFSVQIFDWNFSTMEDSIWFFWLSHENKSKCT